MKLNPKQSLKETLVDPLKDRERTMKLNILLSNTHILGAVIGVLDIFLVLGLTYIGNVLRNLPKFLFYRNGMENFLGLHNLVPRNVTIGKVLIMVFVLLIMDIIIVYRVKTSFGEKNFNVGQKGKQRFVTKDEIKEQYTPIDWLDTKYPGEPGVLISRIGDKFYIDQNVVNNLYIGITRSGKGEMGARPNIEIYSRAEHPPTLIINDPKIEHYKSFKGLLEDRGYEVYLFNCSNPNLSMGFNPLSLVIYFYRKKDYDTAELVANSFAHSFFNVDDATGQMQYFTSAACQLCVAMIWATLADAFQADELYNQERYEKWQQKGNTWKEEHPFTYENKYEKTINLYSMIVYFGELVLQKVDKAGTKTMVDVFFEKRPADDRAKLKYLSTAIAAGKTKSGVFSEMLHELSIFTLPSVARMTAESSFPLTNLGFGEKPIAVFMATPSYDSSLYKLPTIFVRQAYYAVGKECDDHKGKCDRQIKVILEEAGNMPKIDHLATMTTMGLGQNWSMDMYLHDYEQLDEKYGKEDASTIKGNFSNHIYILTKSTETAREFSKMLGNRSAVDVQRAGGKLSTSKYFTESIGERPLLDENQLMNLKEGECVIHRSTKRVSRTKEKIKPYPIFNSERDHTVLPFAHTYFGEYVPNPNEINLLDICTENRMDIDLTERIWNADLSFQILEREQIRVRKLKDLDYEKIKEILKNLFGISYSARYGITAGTSVAEFLDFLEKQQISKTEKEAILAILEEGAVK